MKDTKRIVDTFIRDGSILEVNIDYKARVDIVNNFEKLEANSGETGVSIDSLFDKAIVECRYLLETDIYPRYAKKKGIRRTTKTLAVQ